MMTNTRNTTWPAWSAFWWGILFGLWNLYWSVGGEFGINWLAQSIQDDVEAGDTMLLAMNSVGGIGKILAGLLALATISRWGGIIPRKLHLVLLYAGGVLLILYGGANWTQFLLVELGVIDVPGSIGTATIARWYLVLWEPLWILGGALLILSAEAYRRR